MQSADFLNQYWLDLEQVRDGLYFITVIVAIVLCIAAAEVLVFLANKVGGSLLIGAGAATVTLAGSRS